MREHCLVGSNYFASKGQSRTNLEKPKCCALLTCSCKSPYHSQWCCLKIHFRLVELAVILTCSVAYSVISALWGSEYQQIITDFGRINATWAVLYSIYPIMSFLISSTLLFRALQGAKGQGKAGSLFDRTTGTKSRSGFQGSAFQGSGFQRSGVHPSTFASKRSISL